MTDDPRCATELDTPLGTLTLICAGDALCAITFEDVAVPRRPHPLLARAAAELEEYLGGARTRFTLPLAPRGTPFQREVWAALLTIPYGDTMSYGEIAARLGRPRAVRAVGGANARNPLAIVVPCHRVIGSSGALTGYAGGIERKRWLLELELETRRAAAAAAG